MGNKKRLSDALTLTGQTMEEMLTELYHWYYAQDRVARTQKDCYRIGKMDGAIEAIESVLLQVVGGARLYELWEQETSIQNDDARACLEEQ